MAYEWERFKATLQTRFSPKIDLITLADLLLDENLTASEATLMIAIAGAESGYRVKALNVDKNHGQADYGVYQINEIHKPDMSRVYDPEYNVSQAVRIFRRQGATAWVAFDRGKHLPFMPAAAKAVEVALGGYS